MDKGLLWATATSLLGLAAMGVVAAVVEPPHVALDDLANRLGATVVVEGTIQSIDTGATDWTRIRIADQNVSVELVVSGPVNASAGDRVQATGQVGSFGGRIQLQLQSPSDLVVTVPWRTHHIDLGAILRRPWDFQAMNLLTSGDLGHDEIASADGHTLRIRGHGPARGAHLVEGLLEFQSDGARFQFVVERATPL